MPEALKRRIEVQIFRLSASFVFALGAAIHLGRMIVGIETWQRNVFTPPVDIAFGLIVLVPTVTGWLSWRYYTGGRTLRIVYGFMLFLVTISLPIHLRTAVTWSTEYLNAFPFWYSAVETPMFLILSILALRLKFSAAPAEIATQSSD
jgi:hypothetical protein